MKALKTKLHFKILISSIIISLCCSLFCTIFSHGLIYIANLRDLSSNLIAFSLPILSIVMLYIRDRWLNISPLNTLELAFTNINSNKKLPISLSRIPFVISMTWLTHVGASAGREGVAIQIGSIISNKIGEHFDDDLRPLFIKIGIAAGFSALFQVPITATIFAIELIRPKYKIFLSSLYCFISSIFAYYFSFLFGLRPYRQRIVSNLDLTLDSMLKLILFGVSIGVVSLIFCMGLHRFKSILAKKYKNLYFVFVYTSILVLCIYLVFRFLNISYFGLGTNLIKSSFNSDVRPYDFILKLIFTVATLSIGYQGGEVTPLFSIGATLGNIFAKIFMLPTHIFSAIGYVGVFGSCSKTLLAPCIMLIEIYGIYSLHYFIPIIVAYLVMRPFTGIYPTNKIIHSTINN